jgi:hypothetical protein
VTEQNYINGNIAAANGTITGSGFDIYLNNITVVNTLSNSSITIPVGNFTPASISMDPNGAYVYVAGSTSTMTKGTFHNGTFSYDSNFSYNATILKINTTTNKIVSIHNIPKNIGINSSLYPGLNSIDVLGNGKTLVGYSLGRYAPGAGDISYILLLNTTTGSVISKTLIGNYTAPIIIMNSPYGKNAYVLFQNNPLAHSSIFALSGFGGGIITVNQTTAAIVNSLALNANYSIPESMTVT